MATLVQHVADFAGRVRDQFNAIKPRLVPPGGAAGQALVKGSAADYATAWADMAAGGGPEIVDHPGYVTGRYYPTFQRFVAWANAQGAADAIYYTPMYLPHPVSIDRLGFRTASSNTVGGAANVAIYANAGGWPGAKVIDVGSTAIPGTGNTSIVLSPTTPIQLDAGWHWLAIHCDAAVLWQGQNAESQHAAFFGTTNTAAWGAATSHVNGYIETGVAFALGLPAVAGASPAVSTGALPSASLRIL